MDLQQDRRDDLTVLVRREGCRKVSSDACNSFKLHVKAIHSKYLILVKALQNIFDLFKSNPYKDFDIVFKMNSADELLQLPFRVIQHI